jgi:hypothetical protein
MAKATKKHPADPYDYERFKQQATAHVGRTIVKKAKKLTTDAYDKSPDEDRCTFGPDDIHAGAHQALLMLPSGMIDRVVFQSTVDVRITQLFHGQNNLLRTDQPPILAGPQIVAGPGREGQPNACVVRFGPRGVEFHEGLTTTIGYEAAAAGKLVVSFYRAGARTELEEAIDDWHGLTEAERANAFAFLESCELRNPHEQKPRNAALRLLRAAGR